MNALIKRLVLGAALLAALVAAGCNRKSPPAPSGFPDGSPPPVSASPSGEAPPDEPFPVPSPVVPEIDWTPNSAKIDATTHTNSYTDAGTEVMGVSASYPSTSVVQVDAYYAAAREDTIYRCDKLSSEAKALRQKGALKGGYDYDEDFTVELNAGGLLSVRRIVRLDTGGDSPDTTVLCDTFKLPGGGMLSLDDFFSTDRETYTDRLMYSVRQYIRANRDSLFGDAEAVAFETFPYDTFCVTQNGLSLFYPELTIAPRSMGVVRVDVPWEVFGDIWNTP